MANEAVCIETPKIIKRYSVTNGVAIPKGTLLAVSGAAVNTAIASSGTGAVFAGIAIEEKTASDGITEISAALDGVWDIMNNPTAITIGAVVCMSGANMIRAAVAGDLLTGAAMGKILEPGTGSTANRVRLGYI